MLKTDGGVMAFSLDSRGLKMAATIVMWNQGLYNVV